ncbi:MAG TPA: glutamate--tRNA ligase [Myxococcales bacterium]|jgi:glutamyl-tRNA synthetase|nr:glutamate--tRNA ligase [Myxococcales bacterium]
MPPVRVRFAPSPTGYLHIGGARTALFNWLWARQQKGTFVLRIEDTDRERSTQESVQAILDGMKWMGLDWDEGPEVGGPHAPYFQTQRLATYDQYAEKLISAGKAYRCDCSKETLDVLRKQAQAEKRGFKYPGTCRDKHLPKGTPNAVVRFLMPTKGSTTFDDLVKGPITTDHEQFQDEVILRTDGVPLYNFGAVVDDIEMQITMVSRGDDHVVNTPRQILMYQALEYPVPVFAHLPMILGADKQRLSKRHGAVSVLQYRDDGFLPGALVNYLVRLGWSHGDEEIFTIADLIEKFDWEHVGATAGVFNPQKLEWLNQEWIKKASPDELARITGTSTEFVKLMQERAKRLTEISQAWNAYMVPDLPTYDEKAVAKNLTAETRGLLVEARGLIEAGFDKGAHELEQSFRALAESRGLGLGKLAQPVRVAVTGTTVSPPLFETIVLLGKEKTLKRIDAALEKIK